MVLILFSSSITGCLSDNNDDSSIITEDTLLWLRADSNEKIILTIDINANLTIRDLFNGSILSVHELNDTLISDESVTKCNLDNFNPLTSINPPNESCLIMNGDYDNRNDTKYLYLNICLMAFNEENLESWIYYNRTNSWHSSTEVSSESYMKIELCQFIDFSNIISSEYNENFITVNNSYSHLNSAITYPTDSGVLRVFTNHSFVNTRTGEFSNISIPRSIPGYLVNDGSGWESAEHRFGWEHLGNDTFHPAAPPYPSKDGEYFYLHFCHKEYTITPSDGRNKRQHAMAIMKVPVNLNASQDQNGYDGNGFLWLEKTAYSGVYSCYGNAPIMKNSTDAGMFNYWDAWDDIFVGDNQFISYSNQYGHKSADWNSDENHVLIPDASHFFDLSWFWFRLNHQECVRQDEQIFPSYSHSENSPPGSNVICPESQFYDVIRNTNKKQTPIYDFFTYNIEFTNGNKTYYEKNLEVIYLDGNKLIITGDLYEISKDSSDLDQALYVIFILLIPALLLISSSNFNTFTAIKIEKLSKNQIKSSTIRSIHFKNWDTSKQDPVKDFGDGFINLILTFFYGSIVATWYLVIVALYGLMYLIAAYLIVAGIILLFTAGAVGLICFLPFLILLPLFG